MTTIEKRLQALETVHRKLSGAELLASKWAELARKHPHLIKSGVRNGNA
ncbi:hypothetical protein [Polaromonas sp.]